MNSLKCILVCLNSFCNNLLDQLKLEDERKFYILKELASTISFLFHFTFIINIVSHWFSSFILWS